jgi:hypothetical protein
VLSQHGLQMVIPENELASLIEAYKATNYVVQHNGAAFCLRAGERSQALDQLCKSHGIQTAAFVTAWNPHSGKRSERENLEANGRLQADLMKVSIAVLQGYGQGDDGQWPAEPSFLALGIAKDDAKALGRQYQQNAILWIGSGSLPELVLLVSSDNAFVRG